MSHEFERVCCGDTEFCQECSIRESMTSTAYGESKVFTKNKLGRCDFYAGPSKQVIDTRKL